MAFKRPDRNERGENTREASVESSVRLDHLSIWVISFFQLFVSIMVLIVVAVGEQQFFYYAVFVLAWVTLSTLNLIVRMQELHRDRRTKGSHHKLDEFGLARFFHPQNRRLRAVVNGLVALLLILAVTVGAWTLGESIEIRWVEPARKWEQTAVRE